MNSVQQKNLHDIISQGCIFHGINSAVQAAHNIVRDLQTALNEKATRKGKAYDKQLEEAKAAFKQKQIDNREKKQALATKNDEANNAIRVKIDELNQQIRDNDAAYYEKIGKIDDATNKAETAKEAKVEAIIARAAKSDHIKQGSGSRYWDHTKSEYITEPDGWVVLTTHPEANKVTDKSAVLNAEIQDMRHELEKIQMDLWLTETDEQARDVIDGLKNIRKRSKAIIDQDPKSATL